MRNYQVTVTYDIVAESEDRAKQFVQWHMRQSQALVRQKLEDAGANDGKLTGVHQPHWVMPHVRYVMQDFPAELERELEDKIAEGFSRVFAHKQEREWRKQLARQGFLNT